MRCFRKVGSPLEVQLRQEQSLESVSNYMLFYHGRDPAVCRKSISQFRGAKIPFPGGCIQTNFEEMSPSRLPIILLMEEILHQLIWYKVGP